jgi:hypothetical protein
VVGEPPAPALVPASLAATLDALHDVLAGHRGALDNQVDRVEQAIAVLADPDVVEEALEASRAEVHRQVADITERADRDHQLTEAAQAAQASEAAHTEALATRDAETRAPCSPVYGTHMTRRRLFAPGVLVSACAAALSGVSLSG